MTRYAESLMMWAIIELKAMENVSINEELVRWIV